MSVLSKSKLRVNGIEMKKEGIENQVRAEYNQNAGKTSKCMPGIKTYGQTSNFKSQNVRSTFGRFLWGSSKKT